ncbi:MAG: cation transporter [Clostridia bacterium]|nr:cation transporter [Clostridia bacterium]
MKKNSGKSTLLWSVIMSSPGPLVVGIGLLVGKSSTQLADFIRRSIELLAIILSFIIYCITNKENVTDEEKKQKLEKISNIFVGSSMILSGIIMLILAITSQSSEKGNVIPGLAIAVLGVVANSIFWIRYKVLGDKTDNNILKTQSKLYRAKTFVDVSVTVALTVVLISSNPTVSYYFDLVGTIAVSIYLAYSGSATLYNILKKRGKSEDERERA